MKVSVKTSETKDDCLDVVVEDTGIGIKQKHIGKIFKMFQLIENQKGNKSGTGLGLYICKQIAKKLTCEHHEGLSVSSELKKGTTFSFTLEKKQETQMNIQQEDSEGYLTNRSFYEIQKIPHFSKN